MSVCMLPRSAYVLIAANLVPIVGVLALGWSLGEVMLLFWSENVVIGVFHALRLALVARWGGLFLVPFFSMHYGAFTLVHGLFVIVLFVGGLGSIPGTADVAYLLEPLAWGIAALTVSHGASFVMNFVRGGEMTRLRGKVGGLEGNVAAMSRAADLMFAPYRRVVVMHLTIIFGAFLMMALGTPVAAVVVLVALKTVVDLRAHLAERRRAGALPATP